MNYCFFIFGVFADQIIIVRREVYYLHVRWNMIQCLKLLEESAFICLQIIKLNWVQIHLRRCHKQSQILLIGGDNSIFNKIVGLRFEHLFSLSKSLSLFLFNIIIIINQYTILESNEYFRTKLAYNHLYDFGFSYINFLLFYLFHCV